MTALHEAFAPPGPGGWRRLGDHFPGALTPEYQALYAETCPPGMASYMERYGVLARTLDVEFVHGHLYISPVPLFGPRQVSFTPPRPAIWLLSRLHPEFRRRTRAARRTLVERPWCAAATVWFESERGRWIQRNRGLAEVEPADLGDGQLAQHLRACRSLVADGYRRHFELHGDDLLPIGLLLARSAEWGVDATTAMRALDGAKSPVAATDPPAWQLVTGYDLDSLAWVELGATVSCREAAGGGPVDLRGQVPPEHHDELARLVADARAAVPLRDDNGAITGAWPMGLLRRAMLAVGSRLSLEPATLAVEATVGELVARLDGGPDPSAEVLRTRRADRQRRSALPAPDAIGPEFAIPPLDPLPRPLALIGAAQLAASDHMLGVGGAAGIGTGRHTGRALVVDDPVTALDLIEPGDVVITRSTSPSWNTILTLAGALVTTTGGLVSHAAVIARELGIPAVVGDATASRFTTGDVVIVDAREVSVSLAGA